MKIMVSAGEVSGDLHGSFLVRELKRLDPSLFFFGLGGERLAAEGVKINFDVTRRGTIGIFEALPHLIPLYLVYRKMVQLLQKERPDLLLLIDCQGINLPLAKAAKRLGVKTVYYIPPQEWLWGTWSGVKKAVETIGLFVCIFEKEHAVYKEAGGNSVYFGHPLLDIVRPTLSKEEARKEFLGKEAGSQKPVICLCPGSRKQELKSLFPILLKAGELIKKKIPEAQFFIPVASSTMIKALFGSIGDFRPRTIAGRTYDLLSISDLALCVSGTINLEAALLGVPNIMVYKLSWPTYLIGKYLVKMEQKIPHYCMPNLLLNERVVPELTMKAANPERIAEEALSILGDPSRRQKMKAAFEVLKSRLGSSPVISRCATAVLDFGR